MLTILQTFQFFVYKDRYRTGIIGLTDSGYHVGMISINFSWGTIKKYRYKKWNALFMVSQKKI